MNEEQRSWRNRNVFFILSDLFRALPSYLFNFFLLHCVVYFVYLKYHYFIDLFMFYLLFF